MVCLNALNPTTLATSYDNPGVELIARVSSKLDLFLEEFQCVDGLRSPTTRICPKDCIEIEGRFVKRTTLLNEIFNKTLKKGQYTRKSRFFTSRKKVREVDLDEKIFPVGELVLIKKDLVFVF